MQSPPESYKLMIGFFVEVEDSLAIMETVKKLVSIPGPILHWGKCRSGAYKP